MSSYTVWGSARCEHLNFAVITAPSEEEALELCRQYTLTADIGTEYWVEENPDVYNA